MESRHLFCLARLIFTKGPRKRFPFSQGPVVGSHQSRPPPHPTPTRSCVWGSDGVGLGVAAGRVSRWDGVRFNASALHGGYQLVGDLGQYVFSQPRHAQHMVACAVHVVSEWDKLLWHGKEMYGLMKRMYHVCNKSKALLVVPLHLTI